MMRLTRPTLTTQRLILRPLRLSHAECTYRAIEESRRTLRRWLPFPPDTYSRRDTRAYIKKISGSRNAVGWGIWLPAEPSPDTRAPRRASRRPSARPRAGEIYCGGIGLHGIDRERIRAEVGYWIHRDHEGSGYATEATAAVALWAFDALRLERLKVMAATCNQPSLRVIRKAGFTREGVLRRAQRLPGRKRWFDWVISSIIRPDLRRVRPRLVRLCGRRRPWE
jgi:RimJ/RimL family protein N-acetyltransferase